MSILQEDLFETMQILWLTPYVNDTEENRETQEKLRKISNYLKTFDRIDLCHEHIKMVSPDDRIILIVSGQYGQQLVPKIYKLQQISSIYIYCLNKQVNEQWSNQYKSKVKKVIDTYDDLLRTIEDDYQYQQKQNDSFFCQIFHSTDNPDQTTTILNGHFRHSLLLTEILVQLKSSDIDRKEFIDFCKRTYKNQLAKIIEFENRYSSDRAIWWYTYESFAVPILNKALRVENIEILYLFRFLIQDIYEQLKQSQCQTKITVYRGQLMSDEELNTLRQSTTHLVSINSFFSTSLSRQIALRFSEPNMKLDNFHRVLFEIHADPIAKQTRPFANISQMSAYQEEDEVLFMIGCVFRKVKIYRDTNEHLWIVQLELCGENETDTKELFDYVRKQLNESIDLLLFGNVLIDMGKYDLAERMFNRLLTTNAQHGSNVFRLYESFARLAQVRGDFDLSLENLYTALKNQKDLFYRIISIQVDFDIFEKAHDDNHFDLAHIYKTIATIYQQDQQYSIALDYYKRALSVTLKHIPIVHPDIGILYNSIGSVYVEMKEYDNAELNYNLSLQTCLGSLPANHPTIAMIYEKIGFLNEQLSKWKEAFECYKQAMDIYHRSLASTHPNILQLEKHCERVLAELCKHSLQESLLCSTYEFC